MPRKFWIRLRILGWTLMFSWFVVGEACLLLSPLSQQWVSLTGGFIGAIGTFFVLVGYWMLTREDSLR